MLGIRVDGAEAKRALLAGFPESLFTIPHFDGSPAVLAPSTASTGTCCGN
ncbi:hypothetical protein [Leucobacter triazinivorans]|nr:hypothetical protein [Leucobacter triazinivorans]